jgi:hypothetical protein
MATATAARIRTEMGRPKPWRTLRDDLAARLEDALEAGLGDHVGVDLRDEPQDQAHGDDAQHDLGPDRLDGEGVGRPGPPAGPEAPERGGRSHERQRPGGGDADRPVGAAERQERGVERPDGLPAHHEVGDAGPDQEAAQGDDEGRDALVAYEPALERADEEARGHAGQDRDGHGQGVVEPEAEPLGQDDRLHHGHDARAEREDGAHR